VIKYMNSAFLASAERRDQIASPLPQVVLCGRSNVGKSSLINALGGSEKLARVSRTPGRTQLINQFVCDDKLLMLDLPGYGYAKIGRDKRKDWGKALPELLMDNPKLACALVLVDFRLPPQAIDVQMCEFLCECGAPYLVVGTKCDDVPRGKRHKQALELSYACKLTFMDQLIPTSARTGEGLDKLVRAMMASLAD